MCLVHIICLHDIPDPDFNPDNVNQTHLIRPYYPDHQPMGNIRCRWTRHHWIGTWCESASVKSDKSTVKLIQNLFSAYNIKKITF